MCTKGFGFPPQHQEKKINKCTKSHQITNSQNKLISRKHTTISTQTKRELLLPKHTLIKIFVYLLPVPKTYTEHPPNARTTGSSFSKTAHTLSRMDKKKESSPKGYISHSKAQKLNLFKKSQNSEPMIQKLTEY